MRQIRNCLLLLLTCTIFGLLKASERIDCFLCSQNIPECPQCDSNEFCYILKRSCYQCSRAICANVKYQQEKKDCGSKRAPSCRCSSDETCLITLRNQVQCRSAKCINLVDPDTKFLQDYYP